MHDHSPPSHASRTSQQLGTAFAAARDEGPEAEQCFDVFAGPQLVTSGAAHVGKQRFEGEKIGVGGHAVLGPIAELGARCLGV